MKQASSERTTRLTLKDLTAEIPIAAGHDWNDVGVEIHRGLMPNYMLQPYEKVWLEQNANRRGGWPDCTPYMRHRELLDLLCFYGLSKTLERLVGESAGVHLNLTGWQSTERDWHQDTYLNPVHVGDYYVAVWIALEDIHHDSGPFQYVPGSHRWPVVTRDKILAALDPSERDHRWPKFSERILTPLFEQEIEARQAEVVSYLPSRGDVLVWHSRLLHRGSVPINRELSRKALIAHYSGINHRSDMPPAKRHFYSSAVDGWYFPITT